MQTSSTPLLAGPEVRGPWPDELARLRHFIPEAFLYEENPVLFVGVAGRVERIVAAGALSFQPMRSTGAGLLFLRTEPGEDRAAWITALARFALSRAEARGLRWVYLGSSYDEESVTGRALQANGFGFEDRNEVFAIEARSVWERLHRIYERLRGHEMIPPGVRLSTLLPDLLGPVRRFVLQHMPASAELLAAETAGYKPEHSLVLLVRGEVKGVLLCRRDAQKSFVGLRVVAPELRGGIGWANLLLLYVSLGSALQSGLTETHFEANATLHADTRQMAQLFGARLVGSRVLLRMDLSESA